MTQPEQHRGRPLAETASEVIRDDDTTILAPTALHHPKAIAPAFDVLVMRRDGQWRRQLYCSLHSAEKAMARAKANGVEARCQLVELIPVPSHPLVIVQGGGSE